MLSSHSALKGALLLSVALSTPAFADMSPFAFTTGDLVISTVSGSTLDAASPITLDQFSLNAAGTTATAAGSMALPQTASGANSAISGEYGSASEGFLQLSGNGQYLTLMGYGVNASAFNTAALLGASASPYGATALGQTTSLLGGASTTVPRVVALINGTGNVDSTTALTGVFNTNNPRSAYTADGANIYVSGQGAAGATQGEIAFSCVGLKEMRENLKSRNLKYDERVLPRLNMTQLFYPDPDGISVECNFPAEETEQRTGQGY